MGWLTECRERGLWREEFRRSCQEEFPSRSVRFCVEGVCIDAAGRWSGVERPKIEDGGPRRDRAEEMRQEGRNGEAGSANQVPSALAPGASETPPSPRPRPCGPPPPPGPGLRPRSLIHQPVLLSVVGEGRAPQPVPAWGGGVLRGEAESTSKIPRHLFTHGGDTGRKKAGRPHPAALPAVPGARAGLPSSPHSPPTSAKSPTPSYQSWPAERGGGGVKLGIRLGLWNSGAAVLLGGPQKRRVRTRGGLSRREILKRRRVCQNRSPQSTHRYPPPSPDTNTLRYGCSHS